MPTEKKPYIASFDSEGNLTVVLTGHPTEFKFREPKGRDLETIQLKLQEDTLSPIRTMCFFMETLSLDGLTLDNFLDLPADRLVSLSEVFRSSFRLFRELSV